MTKLARPILLQALDLRFAYPHQPALIDGWSIAIHAGVTLIHGDTGSGKSTLLRVLAGAEPAAGWLTLASAHADTDLAAYQRCVFWCDPATEAFEQVTARDCTAALQDGDDRFDTAAWHEHVAGFALAPHLDKPMYMLSTGSKRKLWLAAALASGRALTLLDEPSAALDAASVAHLQQALAKLAETDQRAVVIASSQRLGTIPLAGLIELPLQGA